MTDEELEMMAQEAKKMARRLTTKDTASDEVQYIIDGIVSQHMSLQKENKILRKALELENNERFANVYVVFLDSARGENIFTNAEQLTDFYIRQAQEELEKEQKDEDRNKI